ncbi:MAG: AAA family ATPase [Bacteroidales bacterium]|nr:AAA family ATPase [Bacteroidales bacterium]
MADLRYPIGMQTFSEIIEEGYTYVDKTRYIPSLLKHGKYIFLSRPRRFGKSLLLSTLEAYFQGRRKLFKGLEIDGMDVEWDSAPVLYFDFNAENYTLENGLEQILDAHLSRYEREYGCDPNLTTISQRFSFLIQSIFEKRKQKVVVLVDEYDKPLLAIEEDETLVEKNQAILKSFYGNLKSMDRYIRFAFITGVARFSKVSIFSDFNNLDDISLTDEFADICGWTEKELVTIFRPGIAALSEELGEGFDKTLGDLRDYYDGYKFTAKGSRLYNPFSVLRALRNREIEPFWFETGTPTFLVRRVRSNGTYPPEINGEQCTRSELMTAGRRDKNPAPLMFQTGYLTIDSYDKDMKLYKLRFPNREVEIGFYQDLLPVYVPATKDSGSPFSFPKFKIDLNEGRPDNFMRRLATLLKDLPGEDHCESTYRAVTYLLATLCATRSIAEHHGYNGRSDIEVATAKYIYLFEFKYNKSAEEAMRQIESRDYAGRFAMDDREVFLIAANFNEKKENRGLEYLIRKW